MACVVGKLHLVHICPAVFPRTQSGSTLQTQSLSGVPPRHKHTRALKTRLASRARKLQAVCHSRKDSNESSDSGGEGLARREVIVGAVLAGSLAVTRTSRAEDVPAVTGLPPLPAQSQEEAPQPSPPPPPEPKVDTTITHRVYFDLSLCPTAIRLDRTLGNTTLICSDGLPMGRIVIGLYGKQVPVTVSHFLAMCTGRGTGGASYKGSIFHRLYPGRYIMAGRQGPTERGEVRNPSGLDANTETINPAAFRLDHSRPGTVSLALAENDDEDELRQNIDYRNVEFMITTGPGPVPDLDQGNIVFGKVLEGLDVVAAVAAIPTYVPDEKIRQLNDFARFLGDERAEAARALWYKPLKAVVISDCGAVEMPKPPLPPMVP